MHEGFLLMVIMMDLVAPVSPLSYYFMKLFSKVYTLTELSVLTYWSASVE